MAAEQQDTLTALAALEPGWLAGDQAPMALASLLEQQAWQIDTDSWEEELELPLSPALLQRWFAPGASYRQQLEQQLGAKATSSVERLLQSLGGQRLPQRLQHRLLRGRRSGGDGAPAMQKPRTSRGQGPEPAVQA
jgi:hypothetical protein